LVEETTAYFLAGGKQKAWRSEWPQPFRSVLHSEDDPRRQGVLAKVVFTLFLAAYVLTRCVPAWAGEAEGPSLLVAEVYGWDKGQDLAHYWVSEKYDGVRASWDGERLRFRSGRQVMAPAWFVAGLPHLPLDGELWLGRGQFQRLAGIVRKKAPIDREWRDVRYMIFELPGAGGTFTERITQIKRAVDWAHLPWLQAVPQFRLPDDQALKKRLAEVVAAGGEGLMLHRAEALYHSGRSPDLMKVKMWVEADAEVVGYLPATGKYQGRMGAMEVKAAGGARLRIGTGFSDTERQHPPPVGSIIIYHYTGVARDGLPRFPVFLRVRQDL
jgi:DNA ligase-1